MARGTSVNKLQFTESQLGEIKDENESDIERTQICRKQGNGASIYYQWGQ
jgi:hypothetical protein